MQKQHCQADVDWIMDPFLLEDAEAVLQDERWQGSWKIFLFCPFCFSCRYSGYGCSLIIDEEEDNEEKEDEGSH